jgi:aminopeptidase N
MSSKHIYRRVIVLTLAASFILSCFTASSVAQRRARSVGAATPNAPRYKQFEGTTHPRAARTYDVLNYSIRTRFDVAAKTVIGDETVKLKPLTAGFKHFALDASDMQVEAVTLADTNTALRWTQPPNKLSITLDRAYQPADVISVRIKYRARPQSGLYFIAPRRGSPTRQPRPAQIWTQGEPEENHHWFPCYDFPDDKATTEQYITAGVGEVAISNGALVETIDNPDGTRTFHWVMDQPYSSYLVSLVVGDYAKMTDAYKNIPLEYYTYHGTESIARRSFSRTPLMMKWFEQALDYHYPYNKYSQIIVANFIFGGMENITATTHADTEILHPGGDDPATAAENLVSHELAHSWFGNLVTTKDWTNLWLNEGFATFMEASFKENQYGHDAYLEEMRENERLYFSEDPEKYRRPLVCDRYRVPVDLFDNTLYKKGALVAHMLRETVGDPVFWKTINIYLNQYQYKSVVTADLQRVFEQTTGQRLDWFFDQWVYKAGYPELRVRSVHNPASRQLTLDVRQTQLPDVTTPAVFRLPVEVEITDAKGARTERIEITRREQRFTFKIDGKPLMIRFDKGARTLKKLDFPQSAAMLSYQLRHSADAIGRIEAAEALARGLAALVSARASSRAKHRARTEPNGEFASPKVIAALRQASARDSFSGVRAAASAALAYIEGDGTSGELTGAR